MVTYISDIKVNKGTHKGQNTNFHSQTPWHFKKLHGSANYFALLIKSAVIDKQIDQVKTIMPWNSCPKYVGNFIIN